MIKRIHPNSDVKKDLQLSLQNAKYLQQLVNETLDLAKLDQGEVRLVRQAVNVSALVKTIKDNFEPHAREKKQQLYISQSHDPHHGPCWTRRKWRKILNNLISNAIKYSDKPGSIYIQLDQYADELRLEVRDQGRGIAPQEIPHIFDRFYQSATTDEGGVGIGLHLVKEFTELHQGTVGCTSSLGRGTIISISFPKSIMAQEETDPEKQQNRKIDPDKSTVLLAEDNMDLRQYLSEKLSMYNVVTAGNGREAMAALENGLMPDLILTDFMMPEMDGEEMVKTLRQSPRWADIPVIFLTAKSLDSEKSKILNLGVDDYLIKPFDLDELYLSISNAIGLSEKRHTYAQELASDISGKELEGFKEQLDTYIRERLRYSALSNGELADHFSISERNLFRKVRLATGQTPASSHSRN
ncbi:MAG: hybrid sensor histidine kinase/response regulator [Cytophagales bacterium]|nr:hybrid sensor histidine kinase/response regulator [Cytophagales bacterium]